jgi:hypothetical protein
MFASQVLLHIGRINSKASERWIFCLNMPPISFVAQFSLTRSSRTRLTCSAISLISLASSARSVFQFDVQGSVAKSTHAAIPWLKRIREAAGERVHTSIAWNVTC